jgi:8-oxo-(d)GTP phosphatase
MDTPSPIFAAGGVVWRATSKGKRRFLLIHRPQYVEWSLPKGKPSAGEGMEAAAMREVLEETGQDVTLGPEIGTVAYDTPAGNHKVVRYWLMERSGGRFRPNPEVAAIEWLSLKKALSRVTHEHDREVLARANRLIDRPTAGRVYVVRHAYAGRRSAWRGPDDRRPLTRPGIKQAEALAEHLTAVPIERVLTSTYLRCRQTLVPLSDALALHIESERRLVEGTGGDGIDRVIRELSGQTAVISTHGDVISGLVGRLAAEGVPLDGPMRWSKGSVWVMDTVGGSVVAGRYEPPVV